MAESNGVLTIGVLGPFEVSVGGRPVELTTGRLRTLLATLAMSAGRTVSVDRLATALWGPDLPADTRRSVQTYVTRLRSALGAASIATKPSGYALGISPDQVDAHRFVRLLDAAATTDPRMERARLAEALLLWRGKPFDQIRSTWLTDSHSPHLTERYLAAVERRIDLDIADRRYPELVAELAELTAQHPLRESLWVRLLVVLVRYGRQAEALERYETIRIRLADELGADPGPDLRQAHTDLLAGRPVETAEAGPAAAARPVRPQQLPLDIHGFSGRGTALKALHDLVGDAPDRITGPVVIAGTAGVGKTTLAVHLAHQITDQFPDGQLYVNLRGFGGQPMTPAEAVRGFLEALGVPPQRVPTDLDAQAGRYRSLLAGKRMLVVLDNARDANQVRPLLAGDSACLVLVTSRNQLTGLIATESAHPIILDLMPVDEARELFTRRVGKDRVAAEPRATDEIVSSCAGLPLALAIAAAQAATHPTFPLATLAGQLRDAEPGLDVFTADDATTDVRTVFSWSYRTLTPEAARLFRLLGLHPGPDLATSAAASLACLPVPKVRPLLAELANSHLLTQHTPGRYTLHDLLRAYAGELAHADETDADRSTALQRLLDYYLHTAHTAAQLLNPHRAPITVRPPQHGITLEGLSDHERASAWFDAEYPVLRAAIDHATSVGLDIFTWQLTWTLTDYLDWRGRWHDLVAVQHAAVDATRHLADRPAQARAHQSLAVAYGWLGSHTDAHAHLQQALNLYHQLGDRVGQAYARICLGWVFEQQNDLDMALDNTEQALELFRAAGHRAGQARALNSVGWQQALRGDHRQALSNCQLALAIQEEIGDRESQPRTWDSLGYAHHHLGDYQQASTCYQRALQLHRELGNRYYEGDTLVHFGETHQAAGDLVAAATALRQALTILDELDHPDAEKVRAKLDRIDQPSER